MEGSCIAMYTSRRWIFAYVAAFVGFMHFSLRLNMSVAILCMVKSRDEQGAPQPSCLNASAANCTTTLDIDHQLKEGEFDWDKPTQSYVLGAYFLGYLVSHIPGGILASRYGGRRVGGFGIGTISILTLFTSMAARQDYSALICLRVLEGLAVGVLVPSIYDMVSTWCPQMELSRMVSFLLASMNVGQVVTWSASGYLCKYGFDNGWGSIFYITGAFGLVATAIWFLILADSPADHPTITREEKEYILQNTTVKVTRNFTVPWLHIVNSKAMWACLVGHFTFLWFVGFFQLMLPTYMEEGLQFNIEENGVLSSVTQVLLAVLQIIFGQFADFLQAKHLSTTNTRKLMQAISFLGSGTTLVVTGFLNRDMRALAVTLLTVSNVCLAAGGGGVEVNHLDFAPTYGGLLYSVTNSLGILGRFVLPIIIAVLTSHGAQQEWRNVFFLCGALNLFGFIIFQCFGSGEIEPWAVEAQEVLVNSEESELSPGAASKTYSAVSGGNNNEK